MRIRNIKPELISRHEIDPTDSGTWQFEDGCRMSHTILYRLRDADLNLIYIGITWNPQDRWRKHRRTKSWWPLVRYVDLQCCSSEDRALAIELAAIKNELPRYNKRGA
jgi:predicted GIY-YIG superfamily endonuclease